MRIKRQGEAYAVASTVTVVFTQLKTYLALTQADKNKEWMTWNINSVCCFPVVLRRARWSFDFISHTHTHPHNTGIMEPVHPGPLLLKIISLSPHLSHLLICNEKTTDHGPLGVSWQQLYELRRQEKRAMEKWGRERERECVREKRGPFSAEIRWYSPFAQNEFIRGVRDSHCWESRFLCDKGVGVTDWREKKSFISCSSEAVTVSGDQQRSWVEGKKRGGRERTGGVS